ncbi:hypothetical protein PsYK624_073950 [Phanerochaete sordida]|uniref:Uncharacterized protein n=1 Tax=Phanerochaete sordida TaxID=48140 RepID=A0A9P3GAJ9_9APHY|nr:hypothetical protein PsYK624_073950 [Phanerochaete sordida]
MAPNLSELEELKRAVEASQALLSFSQDTRARSGLLPKEEFSFQTPAEALLFNSGQKALRLEAPFIGKEFTDKLYIGSDPAGLLYYNDLNDLGTERGEVQYHIEQRTEGKRAYLWIGFQAKDGGTGSHHAVFIAFDNKRSVTALGLDGHKYTGKWEDLSISSSSALVDKRTDERFIKFDVPGIGKTAKMPAPNALIARGIRAKGTLWFKDISKLKRGISADFNGDRIVFMESALLSTDFTAYFIPFETHEISIESTFTINGVEWSDKSG